MQESVWNIISPYIQKLPENDEQKIIYLTGDITESHRAVFNTLNFQIFFEHKVYTSPYHIVFLFDYEELKSVLTDGVYFAKHDLPAIPLKPENLIAIRIEGDQGKDIKNEVLTAIIPNKYRQF